MEFRRIFPGIAHLRRGRQLKNKEISTHNLPLFLSKGEQNPIDSLPKLKIILSFWKRRGEFLTSEKTQSQKGGEYHEW